MLIKFFRVISFATTDAPTEGQQAEVMDQFERLAFAGLDPEQYEVLAMRKPSIACAM